jgi:hypothetical protein
METKPFSMQSPEQIAKDYGGNKQKIAEAMQMGILDPTAGTLAGMFIDRMRSAAQTEQAPQQTVAQQVFAPPAPPTDAPAGLGATPEAAAMPPMDAMPPMNAMPPQEMGAPQMEMPAEEMPMMAEGGMVPPYMAGGGLSDVPLPDGMFDEPSNGGFGDGYAGGGMVAFSGGGSTGDYIERTALSMFPNLQITGRARTAARNAEVGGVPDSFHRIDAARDVRVPPGMSKSEFIAQLKGTFGADYDVLPSKGNSVHIEPGPALGRKVRGGKELAGAAQKPNTLYGLPTDLQGNIAMLTGMMPAEAEEDIEYRKELTEQLSPENRAQAKKDAFFEGLGKLGARLVGAKDKSLLGGLAETLGAGAADIAESLDEDKKRIREMQRERSQLANLSRKEKMEVLQMGVDLTGRVAALNEGIENRKAEIAAKQEEIKLRRDQLNAEIKAAQSKGLDVDQMVFQMFLQGGPLKEAAKEYLGARYKGSGDDKAGPFDDELKKKQNEKQNPAYKFQ